MATFSAPGPDGPGPDGPGDGGQVLSFGAARAPHPPPGTPGGTGPAAPADTGPAAAADIPVLDGEVIRVDQPGHDRPDWLADLAARTRDRRPVIHPALRTRAEALATARWIAGHYRHVSLYHLARVPKYAAKLAIRAPRGFTRTASALTRWAYDLEGVPVRMATVLRADPEAYLKLSRQRDARVRLRVPIAILALIAAMVAAVLVLAAPAPVKLAAFAAAVTVFGKLGGPADRPLIDRAVTGSRAEKLTSDIVIRALCSLGLAAISQAMGKNPKTAIEFTAPITRDGPGWRADLDLPYGVTVAEVMDRRDKLASGLRRPLGCVWPEADHAHHTGRLLLWVGDQDMSTARQPAFPLAKTGTADLFRPVAFGTDQRGRMVTVTLMFVSVIIGSIPRMGKTFLLRLLALIAALDVRAELHLFEFKGTGDLSPLESVAYRYRAGDDDADIGYALADFRALREELRRRTKVIRGLPRDICPENKVTPELASRTGLRLHPVVIAADECQVMFEHPTHGSEFEDICADLVKRGPATGIVLILATQRPDAKSLPTAISANAALRMCLKVMGQVENDMVLGTSAYKNGVRATMFAFSDKGICYFAREGEAPRIVRGFYLDAPATEKIAARAWAARERAGTLAGHATGQQPDPGPSFDLLADLAAVVTEPKMWSEEAVTRLAALRPGAYQAWAALEPDTRAAQLTAALKPYRIRTGQVWGTTADGRGANRRGITRDDLTRAITERNRKAGAGTPG